MLEDGWDGDVEAAVSALESHHHLGRALFERLLIDVFPVATLREDLTLALKVLLHRVSREEAEKLEEDVLEEVCKRVPAVVGRFSTKIVGTQAGY